MLKKLENTVEAYGEWAKRYDYFKRVLASFAEIYNYDFSVSSLMEDGTLFDSRDVVIRKNGIFPRIRGFFSNQLNEEGRITKLYYNESVFDKKQIEEYGYLSMGNVEISLMADMIALAVRLLEACGVKDVVVTLACEQTIQDLLEQYLDALDITYRYKEIFVSECDEICFEILKKQENGEEISFLRGGKFSRIAHELSGMRVEAFGFSGSLDTLVEYTSSLIAMDEKMLDVVVTYDTDKELEQALYLTQELRLNGFKSEYIKRCDKSYIKKFYNTKYVLSVKEKDMVRHEVQLTDLYTNEKEQIKEIDLIQHLDMNF